jgi:hypothetical protein
MVDYSRTPMEGVDVLVAAGGIPSRTTFLREEEDFRSQRKII